MDDKKPENIDYFTFEESMVRAERHVKRWMIAFIIAFVALIGTNIAWVIYENSFQDVITTTQTVTQDSGSAGGTNTFSGDFYGGDYNGEADSK